MADDKRSVVVVGLGTFGAQIATTLYDGGMDVLALDYDQDKVDALAHRVTTAICMDAINTEVLRQHGVFDVDVAIVALRQHFDATVLTTFNLKKAGIEEILVQVDTQQEAEAIRVLGASSVIFPQYDMANQVARQIITPGLTDYLPLAADAALINIRLPVNAAGKTLADLNWRHNFRVTVVAVSRGEGENEVCSIVPPPDEPLQADDRIMVLGHNRDLEAFNKYLTEG